MIAMPVSTVPFFMLLSAMLIGVVVLLGEDDGVMTAMEAGTEAVVGTVLTVELP